MHILVLNSGSSSIKFQIREDSKVLCKGLAECISEPQGSIKVTASNGKKIEKSLKLTDHTFALQQTFKILTDPELGILKSLQDIHAVGHRVVHGGEDYSDSVLIDDKAIETIDKLSHLAPLHNPPNLKGILACKEILPGVPQVAVFDTAFHQTMPEKAYMYALPVDLYERYKIRRYGFHGTSHRYVHSRAKVLAGLEDKPSRIITAHLGNGCSIAAVKNGNVLDTSMGFTPLEGLVMGTRSGDIDPSLPFFLMDQGMSAREVSQLLQKKSGLLGLSKGLSNDMRVLMQSAQTNKHARLAVEVFCYRLKKYIGAYSAVLNGLDVLVFTGGIGENAFAIRKETCSGLEYLGIKIDEELNKKAIGKELLISTTDSMVKVYVIPTDEELVIAQETQKIVSKLLNS